MPSLTLTSPATATWQNRIYRCAVGKNGITTSKHEGDNATPTGLFPIEQVYYRHDRLPPPQTSLPCIPLKPDMGWCDDTNDAAYNQQVTLPYPARHERLWRDDHVYDLICVLQYNRNPIIAGRGSAIFMHLAHTDWRGTEGCIAFALDDLLAILKTFTPADAVAVPATLATAAMSPPAPAPA